MPRKLTVLFATLITVSLGALSLSAASYEGPLEKLMEKIQKNTGEIRKATRTAPAWKKDAKNVAKHAEELSTYAKEAKPHGEAAIKKAKKTEDEWNKLMDDLVKESDALAKLAAKSGTTQVQAKDAFSAVNKTCTACHSVFRIEE